MQHAHGSARSGCLHKHVASLQKWSCQTWRHLRSYPHLAHICSAHAAMHACPQCAHRAAILQAARLHSTARRAATHVASASRKRSDGGPLLQCTIHARERSCTAATRASYSLLAATHARPSTTCPCSCDNSSCSLMHSPACACHRTAQRSETGAPPRSARSLPLHVRRAHRCARLMHSSREQTDSKAASRDLRCRCCRLTRSAGPPSS